MWDEVYRTFREELAHYCYGLCRSEAAAQDLAQDTFLRALQAGGPFLSLSPKQQRAWLYKTAYHLFCDRSRRSIRERQFLDGLRALGEEDEAGQAALRGVEISLLLNRLAPQDRTLFYLRYAEGYNATELGEMFSQPPSTIRARLAKARAQLQLYLTEENFYGKET